MDSSACYRLDPPVRLEIEYSEGRESLTQRRITLYGVVHHQTDGIIALAAWCSLGRRRRLFNFTQIRTVLDDQGRHLSPNTLSARLVDLIETGQVPVDTCFGQRLN